MPVASCVCSNQLILRGSLQNVLESVCMSLHCQALEELEKECLRILIMFVRISPGEAHEFADACLRVMNRKKRQGFRMKFDALVFAHRAELIFSPHGLRIDLINGWKSCFICL